MEKEENKRGDIYGTCPKCQGNWFNIHNNSYICKSCGHIIGHNLYLQLLDESILKEIFAHIKLFGDVFGNSVYHHEIHIDQCKVCQLYRDSR